MTRPTKSISVAAFAAVTTTIAGFAIAALIAMHAVPPDTMASFIPVPSSPVAVSSDTPSVLDANPASGELPEIIDCDSDPVASPTNPALKTDLQRIALRHGAEFSASWYQPGAGVTTIGNLIDQQAWSTSKVPLALAVIQSGQESAFEQPIDAALRWSDNDAAAALWEAVGADDISRAQAVTSILRQAGDSTTTVPGTPLRPPFSVFGQTQWSTEAQTRFLLQLPCLRGSSTVIADMSKVSATQSWGLGQLPGAVFKGGWGPDATTGYLVRQFGWYSNENGTRVPIALAVQSSSFDDGVSILNEITATLNL